jgi:hypothetical protein
MSLLKSTFHLSYLIGNWGFLGKRGIVETVIDQLKNCCQIKHSRHRSPTNAFVNIILGLIAYCFKPRKLAIRSNKLKAQKSLLTLN